MDAEQLRALQAPLKARYREEPEAARVVYQATGEVSFAKLQCDVHTAAGWVQAGLHPAAGGDGGQACSADMLLQALVACSGVTLAAVATAMSLPLKSAAVKAEAELDFRGTLAVDRAVDVGLSSLRIEFLIDSTAEDELLSKLVALTERYCVVLQTLVQPPGVSCGWSRV